ncbi:divalent-cation tolerance protein CutA [Lachnoanaerobaculum saburreum]|uniref:Divalent cation tolerance protein, CutA1 family n=1 Tax=Lachnoanaerobaculum saburreum TaxID=467210 RepID=A0A133ZJ76_9FIRM|nr:divalent-cation tolerance protein CutA [Lachnoanaerobaculum saburreum]KXB55494.1 divalent cation tolerance protein, CutA1 family [Lachnoanaerobaculum saburreum]
MKINKEIAEMSEYCIVLTTFENKEQAKPIIDIILQEKLAACIQEMSIQSHYLWKEELCNDNEILVLIKTTNELYKVLEAKLLEIHPYETPEIIRVDIADGSLGYFSWIKEVTR